VRGEGNQSGLWGRLKRRKSYLKHIDLIHTTYPFSFVYDYDYIHGSGPSTMSQRGAQLSRSSPTAGLGLIIYRELEEKLRREFGAGI
jgi:hypothetical protein